MSDEDDLPGQKSVAEEPLVLGGVDAPVIAERNRSMMEDVPNHVEHERPRRRVFGLFGGRKRSEPVAAPVEPRLDMMRGNPAKEVQRQEPQSFGFRAPDSLRV